VSSSWVQVWKLLGIIARLWSDCVDLGVLQIIVRIVVPKVDYDVLRKEASQVFQDKIVQVQGIVAKLQRTQRAAEQALDK